MFDTVKDDHNEYMIQLKKDDTERKNDQIIMMNKNIVITIMLKSK